MKDYFRKIIFVNNLNLEKLNIFIKFDFPIFNSKIM